MEANSILNYIENVLKNTPSNWLHLTTHRLDIYNESLAKTEFTERFEDLYKANTYDTKTLDQLPTAYDYIRLGHPLSCVLEWTIAKLNHTDSNQVISFSSQTIPVLAILRKNLLEDKNTRIVYTNPLPSCFNFELLKNVYGYTFVLEQINNIDSLSEFNGSTVYISQQKDFKNINHPKHIDFNVTLYPQLGSILTINDDNQHYVSDIQHVRRRETIAMTPTHCYNALENIIHGSPFSKSNEDTSSDKKEVLDSIMSITGSNVQPLVGSSGLSIQYAIMMGLVQEAQEQHPDQPIKFIVPPNCYGGTNDQARRVAACLDHVEIVDLPVDGDNDMVQSINTILDNMADEDAIPYIIAEIPTNPRVEVPNLNQLQKALATKRYTKSGAAAIDPVFILDQTFCPNFQFLGDGEILSTVRAISYASGSKFPSGGKCTAGYCIANKKAEALMRNIQLHLELCDNEATSFQYKILAEQLPSMTQRIKDAYLNTRAFVDFIQETLPEAKINFVSRDLAAQGFTPSVFSLGLPTKGETEQEREDYKRALNLKLIHMMITEIPDESKYCVSYGQLKGCYWTIPATSTQGTTKEADKDYIVRASLSPNLDLERHKEVFLKFVKHI